MKRIVNVSGGAASAVALLRVVERFGTNEVFACFSDVGSEEPSVYRFVDDLERVSGVEIIRLGGSETTWGLFERLGMWTSNRGCVASHHLKKVPLRIHAEQITSNHGAVIYVGFGPDEEDRMQRLRDAQPNWTFDFPLTWKPLMLRCDILAECRRRGLNPTTMYDQGYPHANCGGACVLAGIGQWRALLHDYPDRYRQAEEHEQRMMKMMADRGRTVRTILKDRRGGVTRNLSLSQLREEDARGRPPDDRWQASSCSCAGNLWDDTEEVISEADDGE